jgi:hypothetical protein
MNFLKKLVIKWVREDWNRPDDCEAVPSTLGSRSAVEMDRAVHFQVLPATGGTIVQIRKYDRRKDDDHYSTYVIPDGNDIAKEVGHIVSLEILKHG